MPSFLSWALIGANATAGLDMFLLRRQLIAYNPQRTLPADVLALGITNEENFRKAQIYNREKTLFALIVKAKELVETNLVLLWQLLPKLWYSTQKVLASSPFLSSKVSTAVGSFAHCVTFQAALDVIELISTLPQDIYYTFVIEARHGSRGHGFNKTTPAEFAKDKLKKFILKALVLNPIISSLVNFVVHRFGASFPMFLFGAGSALSVLAIYIAPVLIMPLFNKFTPLPPDSELSKSITALARKLDFPLSRVLVMDASKRSGHSNAFFYGFFNNKRIVLFDTLVEQMTEQEILAVLSHEMGHWHHNHTALNFGVGLGQLAAFAFALRSSVFNPDMYRQFGFREQSPFIGATLFSLSYMEVVSTLLHFIMTRVSRRCEFQADAFAVKLGYREPLRTGLVKLHGENLSALLPDPLYASLHYSHPPLLERLSWI
jgi:STE24 endopeptidase